MALGKTQNYLGRFVERIYGRDGMHETLHLTRIKLTPVTQRWGGLYFHIFHRGDEDPDPHDHPWNFKTLPLTSYWETVMDEDGQFHLNLVRAWRWSSRPKDYVHRIVCAARGTRVLREAGREATELITTERRKIVTLVWYGPKLREWGFWVREPQNAYKTERTMRDIGATERAVKNVVRGHRIWVHWRPYLLGKGA